jgi:metal-dependent HD superfamily phosphatase/phosphodiesterase
LAFLLASKVCLSADEEGLADEAGVVKVGADGADGAAGRSGRSLFSGFSGRVFFTRI